MYSPHRRRGYPQPAVQAEHCLLRQQPRKCRTFPLYFYQQTMVRGQANENRTEILLVLRCPALLLDLFSRSISVVSALSSKEDRVQVSLCTLSYQALSR
jgi:hypothetical protein